MRTHHTNDSAMPIRVEAKLVWKRLVPLLILGSGIAVIYGLELHTYLSFEQLRLHRSELMTYVATMPIKAVFLFIVVYAVATALSLPGGIVLTLAGGFLFGIWEGSVAVVIGATLGATTLFAVARSAFGDVLRAQAGPWLEKMETGFQENAFSYMLTLRLIPGFPFFVVNLVPAFLGVPLWTYVVATFVGIIPGTVVFASIGAGLGSIFDSMQEFSLTGTLTPQVLTALVGLGLLSLIPVVWKRVKASSSR